MSSNLHRYQVVCLEKLEKRGLFWNSYYVKLQYPNSGMTNVVKCDFQVYANCVVGNNYIMTVEKIDGYFYPLELSSVPKGVVLPKTREKL